MRVKQILVMMILILGVIERNQVEPKSQKYQMIAKRNNQTRTPAYPKMMHLPIAKEVSPTVNQKN